jgi:hypothetical protein
MSKYLNLYNQMQPDKYYTAAELHVAPATMTAMVNRGFAEKTNTTPRKYIKSASKIVQILSILSGHEGESFIMYTSDRSLGMLCTLKNEGVYDCWEKKFNTTNATKLELKNKQTFILD